jgi:hypothetical protein
VQRGKNSTRVLSVHRRKQARVASNTYCRLVPGDIIELLYDQQGQYAFKVRQAVKRGWGWSVRRAIHSFSVLSPPPPQLLETTPNGMPLLHATELVTSVSAYVPPARLQAQQQLANISAILDQSMSGGGEEDPSNVVALSASILRGGSGPAPPAGSQGGGVSPPVASRLEALVSRIQAALHCLAVQQQQQPEPAATVAWSTGCAPAAVTAVEAAAARVAAVLADLQVRGNRVFV